MDLALEVKGGVHYGHLCLLTVSILVFVDLALEEGRIFAIFPISRSKLVLFHPIFSTYGSYQDPYKFMPFSRKTLMEHPKEYVHIFYFSLSIVPNPLETDFPRPMKSGIMKLAMNSPLNPMTEVPLSVHVSSWILPISSLMRSVTT